MSARSPVGRLSGVRPSPDLSQRLKVIRHQTRKTLARAVTLAVSMAAGYLLALPAVPRAVRARFRPTDHLTGPDEAAFRFEPGRTGGSAAV